MIRSDMALLQVEGLTVRRGTRTILDNLDLTVESGECVILTGENGSGKSTLIESVTGILPIQSGSVDIVQPFGLTLQSGGINGDEVVGERLTMTANCAGVADSEDLLSEWSLQHRSQDLVCHLSGGLYRRLAVLQGLMPAYGSENRICILDEPSEGLDENAVKTLVTQISALRSRGNAFLIATHDSRLHECATRLIDLDEGNSENATPITTSQEAPMLPNITPHLALSKWSSNLDRRTMWPLLSRGMPLIASCLILYAILGESFGSLMLIPAFLASVPSFSSLHHAKDARSGDWLLAMGGRLFAIDPVSVLLILFAPLLTVSIFGTTDGIGPLYYWLMVGLPFIGIYLASGAIDELANKMPRSQAQFIPLLKLVLIWPFLITSNSVEQCYTNALCEDLSMSILFATSIPLIIAFGLPILHPRTASN